MNCPRCQAKIPGLEVIDGELRTTHGVIIGSFWCGSCQRMIHWGKRVKPVDKR